MSDAIKTRLVKIRREIDGLLERWDALSSLTRADEIRIHANDLDDLHSDADRLNDQPLDVNYVQLACITVALLGAMGLKTLWP